MSVLKTYGEDAGGFRPSRTYRIAGDRIEGFCDGREAVAQAVELALSTERWRHLIYSGDYGIELEELFGQPRGYLEADIERRFAEALAEDDRVTGIRDFTMSFEGDTAVVSFTAGTVFGDLTWERGVTIGAGV